MARASNSARSKLWAVGIVWAVAVVSLVFVVILRLVTAADGLGGSERAGLALKLAGGICAVAAITALGLTNVFLLMYVSNLQANNASMLDDIRRLMSSQTNNLAVLTQISENLLLSDSVKSVAFREKDRMVLEEAIEQDMRMEKWDSATLLIDEFAERFGSKQQAEELRKKLQYYKNATIEEKIDDSVKHIESLWLIHHYDEAEREVTALARLYPESAKVRGLEGQTEARRQAHKTELLARWDKAVKSNDVEQGVELLKLLDNYLTPTEAAALEESARGVFQAKLHNMGVQFSLFVTEKRWDKALKLGREIIEEFPNSRMAQEVREKLSILQQRAEAQTQG